MVVRLENKAIRSVAVIGGGTMGVGIARVAAGRDIAVYLCEKDAPAAGDSSEALARELDYEMSRWSLTASEKEAVSRRIRVGFEISDAAGADLVIETVSENFELKSRLFTALDAICDKSIIFITNTSTLSISELAAASRRADRFVGLHFLNPATRTAVVEVIRGLATSDATVAAVKDFSRQLGKTPIEVFEYPGYVTTRVMLPMINEAIHVVMEGVASAEDVDTAMKLGYNLEAGPLALADRMGLDEVMHWMEHLFRELGDLKYRPCPLLRKMVRAGRLGVKSGEGFFRYEKAE
ncbi:MAG: FAD-dependent oxidoreductase [Bryobacterales bacterium]